MKGVIHSMMLHIILIYSWLYSLIEKVEIWMIKFVWSRNITIRKMVTVSWDSVCTPASEGGIGIRNLSKLNEASGLKLCWELLHSNEHWETMISYRVLRMSKTNSHHIYSSIWSSIKHKFQMILNNSSWLLGDGLRFISR